MLVTPSISFNRTPKHSVNTQASAQADTSNRFAPIYPSPIAGSLGEDQVVPPAAPPSAVQMQIKALISEQTLSLETGRTGKMGT
ncbi:hypothetical protein [Marivita sp. XM-24bin2]|jgi:hypothetical protein|uniref:hypothetical protein n=1 Tax=unclassified Marivita TaxID=2632480 RepID=UPI000D799D63|nr:hypothetical protein [Marivita sp. XM-24bin2]MCR9109417.1 hypothetical protein [Paracoccaceae bacterium]PWL35413.1 MAG: hypothetical protein DCO97_09005 [Marivita sp. XM-24bin2]